MVVPVIMGLHRIVIVDLGKELSVLQFDVITNKVDFSKIGGMAYPCINLLFRFGLCLLLLMNTGLTKSGLFHLLVFSFTCYVVGTRPMHSIRDNTGELLKALFLLLLSCIIAVVFTGAYTSDAVKYSMGSATNVLILVACIVNTLVVAYESLRITYWSVRKCWARRVWRTQWKIKLE